MTPSTPSSASGWIRTRRTSPPPPPPRRTILLDAKRGDISTTAEAYAAACYTALGADAVTINGYMGVDSVAPFTADPAKGVFVLCKTSNPSSGELQALTQGMEADFAVQLAKQTKQGSPK